MHSVIAFLAHKDLALKIIIGGDPDDTGKVPHALRHGIPAHTHTHTQT